MFGATWLNDAGSDLAQAAMAARIQVAVAPVTVDEVRHIDKAEVRQRLLQLIAREGWLRLMPVAYSECAELKSEISGCRPAGCCPRLRSQRRPWQPAKVRLGQPSVTLEDLARERWAAAAATAFGPLLSLREAFDAEVIAAASDRGRLRPRHFQTSHRRRL